MIDFMWSLREREIKDDAQISAGGGEQRQWHRFGEEIISKVLNWLSLKYLWGIQKEMTLGLELWREIQGGDSH